MTWHEFLMRAPGNEHSLEATVLGRLQGRLLDFSIEESNGSLLLRGTTYSYHVKQLAQNEVMCLTSQPICQNAIEVRPRVPCRTTGRWS